MSYQIIEAKPDSQNAVSFRGGIAEFWRAKDPEVILSGPAQTGKSFGALHKLDALCWKYPHLQCAIVRKSYKSLGGSVCQTFQLKVANMKAVRVLGGERPERYIYPNGSTIWLGGMDNPDKVLSSERDFIFVNQVEELEESEWEVLATRASGRAGNAPYAQMLGDCNPGGSGHWILQRARRGVLKMIPTFHTDNPTLYDDTGAITELGVRTMQVLESLSGVRRERLLLGKWVSAEGAVYDIFDRRIHALDRQESEFQRFALALDEGYTNPAVILLIGIDGDKRLHICREFYARNVLQKEVVATALDWYLTHECEEAAVDQAAAGLIADLRDVGMTAVGRKGRVLDGITVVQDFLKVAGDGRPRLSVSPQCVNTINEFESYTWKEGKDEPVKENDHAMDALRDYNGRVFADTRLAYAQAALEMYHIAGDDVARVELIDESMIGLQQVFLDRERLREQYAERKRQKGWWRNIIRRIYGLLGHAG